MVLSGGSDAFGAANVTITGPIAGPWNATFAAQDLRDGTTLGDGTYGLMRNYLYLSSEDQTGSTSPDSSKWIGNEYGKTIDCPQVSGCTSKHVPESSVTRAYTDFSVPDDEAGSVAYACAYQYVHPDGGSWDTNTTMSTKCIAAEGVGSCSATDVTLDFGDLSPVQFSGAKKSNDTIIHCTSDVSVTISFSPKTITLSNGATASLTSSGTAYINRNIDTPLVVTAELHGTPDVGSFNGSSTIILTMQ
jgi:spore coat protein U-like protein